MLPTKPSRHGESRTAAAVETEALDAAEAVDDVAAAVGAVDEAPAATFSPAAAALLEALPTSSTPYLTCSRCNSVTFINVLRVRRRDADASDASDESRLREFEQLPICTGCGSTKYLRAGVVSFQEKIEEERNAIKEFECKRVPATALIQRVARGFLGRLAFRRRKVERERHLRTINRSAARIQTRVRGMQARRRAVIERCLRLVKTMHPSVLAFALGARPDRPPVFWYDNPAERSVLFWNYREFVRRAGGRPPLAKVEANVLEITRRMLLREFALVSRIQARWRGLTARLAFRELKRQRAWLRGIRQSPAIKVQRLFRGHASRKQSRALRVTTQYPSQLAAYRQSRAEQAQRETRKAFRAKLLSKYRLEYQVGKTTRMLTLQPARSGKVCAAAATAGAAGEAEIGPETHAHVSHSLRASQAPSRSPAASTQERATRRRKGAASRSSHEGSRKMFSIGEDERAGGGADSSDREDSEPRNRNTNARRFAELKRSLEAKSRGRLRDPRAHILRAQQLLLLPSAPRK